VHMQLEHNPKYDLQCKHSVPDEPTLSSDDNAEDENIMGVLLCSTTNIPHFTIEEPSPPHPTQCAHLDTTSQPACIDTTAKPACINAGIAVATGSM
jgi:hypothetical protein